MSKELNNLISEIENTHFTGWDFSYLKDRFLIDPLSWDYKKIIMKYIKHADTLLDMGTGGGEFLSTLKGLPKKTYATENYKPNIKIAIKRLGEIGIKVFGNYEDNNLPFRNEYFDLIINRHESYISGEIERILKKDGIFITQQVGRYDEIELNDFFKDNSYLEKDWDLKNASKELIKTGFKIIYKKEEIVKSKFTDIGAVIFLLKAVPWQIPDFNIENYLEKIEEMHKIIKDKGYFKAHAHRFILIAEKT